MSKTLLLACVVCGFRLAVSGDEPRQTGCLSCGSSLAKIDEVTDEQAGEILKKYGNRKPDTEGDLL